VQREGGDIPLTLILFIRGKIINTDEKKQKRRARATFFVIVLLVFLVVLVLLISAVSAFHISASPMKYR